ncbi:MAG: glycosyltransferase [Chloroflexi bacterium]|nr:glycosyltransferase [Chloroflexota bacterium]
MAMPQGTSDLSPGPLVSLLMAVKNGMPYLPEAVWSVAAQTYPNLELVVQDGCSTDGTREFLATVRGMPRLDVVSAPDASSAEGFSRALARCRGAIIGSIDADNVLEPDAVAWAVEFFAGHPDVACVYGSTWTIDQDSTATELFTPPSFDLLRVMSCEVVPPLAAAFFSRRVCGDDLRFDPTVAQVDFDLWLRLGHLPIVTTPKVLARVRAHARSNTCRLENYEWYCRDKIAIVEAYLARYVRSALTEAVRRHALAGIYTWAGESLLILGGDPEVCTPMVQKAAALDPEAPPLRALRQRTATAWQQRGPAALNASAPPAGGARSAGPAAAADGREADPYVAERVAAAQRLLEAGDGDGAAGELARALDREPTHAQAQYLLGCVELRRGRAAAAVAVLREVVRTVPEVADVHNAYAVALQAAGRGAEAEVAARAAVELAGDRADLWANLAELYEHRGCLARAAAAYARAAALMPGATEARAALERVQALAVSGAEAVAGHATRPPSGGSAPRAGRGVGAAGAASQ